MPEIDVVQPHALGVDAAKERLGGFQDLLSKYGVRLEWSGPQARLAGVPGVGGKVEVAPSEVRVNVTVSKMLTLMGLDPVRLKSTIAKRLSEALG
ncbi:MAG: polyhydroxyalkanoic acid system family protein [Myxococcota bacterium]